MTVTFQIQIDPLDGKEFDARELTVMKDYMNKFRINLEQFHEYIRDEMYVNNEVYYGGKVNDTV
jgi:hypothetical protein